MIDDRYEITTPAAEEPVTLTETKAWLRVEHSADDALITALITGARQFAEKFCNRIFVETDIDCYFGGLVVSNSEQYPFVQVRRAPLLSVGTVETFDGGAYAATTDYDLKAGTGFPRFIFADGITSDLGIIWPIKITAGFGYGAAADVPEDIKTAIKQHVAFWYENRGDTVSEGKLSMPLEVRSIYTGKYRILNTFG